MTHHNDHETQFVVVVVVRLHLPSLGKPIRKPHCTQLNANFRLAAIGLRVALWIVGECEVCERFGNSVFCCTQKKTGRPRKLHDFQGEILYPHTHKELSCVHNVCLMVMVDLKTELIQLNSGEAITMREMVNENSNGNEYVVRDYCGVCRVVFAKRKKNTSDNFECEMIWKTCVDGCGRH